MTPKGGEGLFVTGVTLYFRSALSPGPGPWTESEVCVDGAEAGTPNPNAPSAELIIIGLLSGSGMTEGRLGEAKVCREGSGSEG